jgi:carbonic anhydrase
MLKNKLLLSLPALLTLAACKPAEKAASDASATKAVPASDSARPAHWGYEGEDGPPYWPKLSPVYAACGEGKSQSPINITQAEAGETSAWKLDYQKTKLKISHHAHVDDIIDNGHTIQVTVDGGSTLTTDKDTYVLKQFHFHTPSEHTVDGAHMPLEIHFVHQSADGKLAVVGVLVREGPANENLAKLITHFPTAKGETKHVADVELDLKLHLPDNVAAYHYSGSLTTPPCTENVDWMVLRDPITASPEQLAAFEAKLGKSNRPVQSLHGRSLRTRLLQSKAAE